MEFPDDEGIDATDWPSHSSDLNPAEKLWHKYWSIQIYQVAPQAVQELAYAFIQVWQEIPRTPSAFSSGACTDIVGSAYKHAGPYTLLTLWVAVMKFLQSCTSHSFFFFQCIFESCLNGLKTINNCHIILILITQCIQVNIFNLNILFIKIQWFKYFLNFYEQCIFHSQEWRKWSPITYTYTEVTPLLFVLTNEKGEISNGKSFLFGRWFVWLIRMDWQFCVPSYSY